MLQFLIFLHYDYAPERLSDWVYPQVLKFSDPLLVLHCIASLQTIWKIEYCYFCLKNKRRGILKHMLKMSIFIFQCCECANVSISLQCYCCHRTQRQFEERCYCNNDQTKKTFLTEARADWEEIFFFHLLASFPKFGTVICYAGVDLRGHNRGENFGWMGNHVDSEVN